MRTLHNLDRLLQKVTFTEKRQVLLLSDYVEVTKYVAPADYFKLLYQYKKGADRMFAADALAELGKGSRLSDAAKYWFHPTLVKALEIGENNGKIEETMPIALKTVGENRDGLAESVASLIKPTLYLSAALVAMFSLKEQLVPVSLKLVNNDIDRLTDGMRNLVDTTNWISAFGYLVPIGIIVTCVWFSHHLRNNIGPLRNKLDKLPVYKQYALYKGAQFIMNYSVMKEMGEADKNIIASEHYTAGAYYKKQLEVFNDRLLRGEKDLNVVLSGSLFGDEFLGRLRIISGTENFTAALTSAAVKTNKDVIKEAGMFIKGVSLIIFGAVIAITFIIMDAVYGT